MSVVRVRSSSVGAYPRPKPILVSRAESAAPVAAAEVRCGCQFYQSDSLLPDRINPIGSSRPDSSVDYYVETISRPISPLSITSHHSVNRVEIVRPEPIIIGRDRPEMDSYSFRPIRDKPPKYNSTQNNYLVYAEDSSSVPEEQNNNDNSNNHMMNLPPPPLPARESTPTRPSLLHGKDRLSDRNINVSSQILRNRSRSTSLHGSAGGGDNVGKIVKTVSFEFGGPDGPDQYRSPYAEHDLINKRMTAENNNNDRGGGGKVRGNKGTAHSFVKFERKDRSTSQDRYSNERYKSEATNKTNKSFQTNPVENEIKL